MASVITLILLHLHTYCDIILIVVKFYTALERRLALNE